ncbi:hypothetical protein [Legionella gresilensis]|uniref:hypothetical protein n=1 Tax=Legionella gresilensis TaxID=91823 RepID=UPI0010413D96|nr:hypothetical protein [Legionella gresilensis]
MRTLTTIISKSKKIVGARDNASEKAKWHLGSLPSMPRISRNKSSNQNNKLLSQRLFTSKEGIGKGNTFGSNLEQQQTIKRDDLKGPWKMKVEQFKPNLSISASISFFSSLKEVEVKSKIETKAEQIQPQVKALCLFGGAATLAAIWEVLMVQPYKLKGTEVVIVSSPMWIEGINEQLWANQPWGQPKRYLPKAMRYVAGELFPDHGEDKPLTFKMVKDVVIKLRELLKEAGVKIIEEEVEAIKESKDGLTITKNGTEQVIIPHHDYHVIHSGKKLIEIPGIKLQHFGNAYKKSAEELAQSPMAIVASGLNAIWATRDFKGKTNLIYIIPKGDRILPMDHFDCVLRLEEAEFFTTDDEDRIIIRGLCIKNNKVMTWDVHKDVIYSAKGFELSDVVEVNETKITIVDTAAKPHDLYSLYDLKGEKRLHTNDMRGTLVPPGNLASNCRSILSAVGKVMNDNSDLILGDGQAITSFEAWKEATFNKAKKQGVSVHEDFYKLVFNQIKSVTTHFLPHDDQLWEVMKRLFNKGILVDGLLKPIKQPVAVNCNGEPISLTQFEIIFRKPVQLVVVNKSEKPKETECEGIDFKM